jgi:hypothetical protein
MTHQTMQAIDAWILLIIAIWFVPKGLLFLATAVLSWKLTPASLRTSLGNAYRVMFVGLFVFSEIMCLLFITRWLAGPPIEVTTVLWVAMILRVILLVVMAFISACEAWVARELIRRVRCRRFLDLDGAGLP